MITGDSRGLDEEIEEQERRVSDVEESKEVRSMNRG